MQPFHWTERSTKDYQFRIAADFISQLEEKMELENITPIRLAEITGLTKGRISQVLNNPGNMTIENIVKFARAVGLKVSLVAYDDNDPRNTNGPINSDIFRICWENSGKPRDFWAFENSSIATTAMPVCATLPAPAIGTTYVNVAERGFSYALLNSRVYGAMLESATAGTFGTAGVELTANTEDGEIKKPEKLGASI